MTALNVILEQFDHQQSDGPVGEQDGMDVHLQQEKAAAYAAGFAAGQKAAASKSSIDESFFFELKSRLDAAIERNREAISTELLQGLEQSVRGVFPAIAKSGYAAEVAALITEYVTATSETAVVVKAPPQHCEALGAALADVKHSDRISVEPDDSLGETESDVSWGEAGVHLDIDGAIGRVTTFLQNTLDHERKESLG